MQSTSMTTSCMYNKSHCYCKLQNQSPEGVLKNLQKSTAKHMCRSLFLNKVAGLKKDTDTGVFL